MVGILVYILNYHIIYKYLYVYIYIGILIHNLWVINNNYIRPLYSSDSQSEVSTLLGVSNYLYKVAIFNNNLYIYIIYQKNAFRKLT